jgi:hypothetical protein
LRDDKRDVVRVLEDYSERLNNVQRRLNPKRIKPIPTFPRMTQDEEVSDKMQGIEVGLIGSLNDRSIG